MIDGKLPGKVTACFSHAVPETGVGLEEIWEEGGGQGSWKSGKTHSGLRKVLSFY